MKTKLIFATLIMGSMLTACTQNAASKSAPLQVFAQSIQPHPVWAVEVGHGTEKNYLRLEPAVRNQVIYAADYHGDVLAIDRADGRVQWHVTVAHHITSGVGAGNNVVAVGTQSGYVYGVDQNNGRVLWRARVPGEVLATPTIANNTVFIKTQTGRLFALDAHSGRQLWRYRIDNPSLILRSDSAVVVTRDLAISGFADGAVVAFDQHSGKTVWHMQLAVPHGSSAVERMVDITADPYVENGVMYLTSYQGRIAALDVDTGRVLWKKDFSGYAGLTVGPKAVYVTDSKSHVWAFNKNSGAVLWHNDQLDGRGVSGPAYNRGKVVVGDKEGYAHWLAATDGHFLARDRADHGSIYASPIATNVQTYFYSSRGQLVAYEVR